MTNEDIWKQIHATPCHAAGLKRRLELLAMLDPAREPPPRRRSAPSRSKARKPRRQRTPEERRQRALWVALRREGLIYIHARIGGHHTLLLETRKPYLYPNKKEKRKCKK